MLSKSDDAISDPEQLRARTLDKLRHDEREAAVGRVASTLSHALGTPLNVIAGRAAMIGMEGMSVEEMRNNARIVEEQVRQVAAMLRRVLGFAREQRPGLRVCDARLLCANAVAALEPIAESRGVALSYEQGPTLEASLECDAVLQTVTNLLSLGIHKEPSGGRVSLALELAETEPPLRERGRVMPGRYLRFAIHYASTELPERLFDAVYEPWLVQDCADRDAALVLALSYGVARENRGWVDVESRPGPSALTVNWPYLEPGRGT